MNEQLVSIIILNFNGGIHVKECVESIFKTKNCNFEIILIDNNSTDNSHIICKEMFPHIILIRNNVNMGMSARNIGLDIAKGKFIVFLDSDTLVTPEWLDLLIESYNKNGPALYQPKILRKEERNKIDSAGNMINIFGLAYACGKGELDSGQYDQFKIISYSAGGCVFTSREIIQKIGKIDEIFFAYHDDVDYGWRALLLGIPSYYEPKAVIYHLSSPTLQWSKKKFFLLERNRWICLLSLYSKSTLIKIFPLLLLTEIGIFFYFVRKGMTLTKIKSSLSVLKLLLQVKKRTDELHNKRIVNDKEIIKNFVDDLFFPTYAMDKHAFNLENNFIIKLNKLARKII